METSSQRMKVCFWCGRWYDAKTSGGNYDYYCSLKCKSEHEEYLRNLPEQELREA